MFCQILPPESPGGILRCGGLLDQVYHCVIVHLPVVELADGIDLGVPGDGLGGLTLAHRDALQRGGGKAVLQRLDAVRADHADAQHCALGVPGSVALLHIDCLQGRSVFQCHFHVGISFKNRFL